MDYFIKVLEKTYNLRCDVYTYEQIETDGVVRGNEEVLLYSNIPCAISIKNIPVTEQGHFGEVKGLIKLFLSPKYEILENSTVVIDGKRYIKSGVSTKYDTHQEIQLSIEEKVWLKLILKWKAKS